MVNEKKKKYYMLGIVIVFIITGFILALQKEEEEIQEPVIDEMAQEEPEELLNVIPNFEEMIEKNQTDEVFMKLGDLGLACEVEYSYNEDEPNYYISEMSVEAGDEIPENGIIHVTINVNDTWAEEHIKDTLKVEMPNVVGLPFSGVMSYLGEWGITNIMVDTIFSDSTQYEIGEVVSQSVAVGELVLTQDKCYEETDEPTLVTITIFGGKDPEAVITNLENEVSAE